MIQQQAQERIADTTGGAAVVFASLTFFEVLQYIGLTLTILCAAFSLYFHVKRFLKERKEP